MKFVMKYKNPIAAIKEFLEGLLYWESDGYTSNLRIDLYPGVRMDCWKAVHRSLDGMSLQDFHEAFDNALKTL